MPNYSGVWTLQQQLQAKAASSWPAVPGAPTIGTATKASLTSVSVAFTAPSDLGIPATITGYTATSSPGGITGTGVSSPIVVSGLTTGTAYTFTVTATNASGTGPASAASNSVTPALLIGDSYEGGFYAGQISTAGNSIANFNLVVGPVSSAQSTLQWKTSNSATAGTSSDINGPTNSANMNNAEHPAAQFCEGRTIGGFSDWYMPAKNELEICYYNLKPTTNGNLTSFDVTNINAVPSRSSNYTSGTPAQTSAADFKDTGTQDFVNEIYWSSTEVSGGSRAWRQSFSYGAQGYLYKDRSMLVRAIRRVAV